MALVLYREEMHNHNGECGQPGVTDVYVRKNRNGQRRRVGLFFDKQPMTSTPLPDREPASPFSPHPLRRETQTSELRYCQRPLARGRGKQTAPQVPGKPIIDLLSLSLPNSPHQPFQVWAPDSFFAAQQPEDQDVLDPV